MRLTGELAEPAVSELTLGEPAVAEPSLGEPVVGEEPAADPLPVFFVGVVVELDMLTGGL
jgi:hypothetical protein